MSTGGTQKRTFVLVDNRLESKTLGSIAAMVRLE